METQSDYAAESSVQEGSGTTEQSFGDKVNSIVAQMSKDDSGKWVLPEMEMSEAEKFAVNAERRRRDTESALSKTRLQLKVSEKTTKGLKSKVVSLIKPQIPENKLKELETLKFEDPEAWHQELVKLEKGATSTLDEDFGTLTSEASQQAIIEYRQELLDDYNSQNPNAVITDDIVQNDLPPSLVKSLDSGSITFDQFLKRANKFLTQPKKIGSPNPPDISDLGTVGGTAEPSREGQAKAVAQSYGKTVF